MERRKEDQFDQATECVLLLLSFSSRPLPARRGPPPPSIPSGALCHLEGTGYSMVKSRSDVSPCGGEPRRKKKKMSSCPPGWGSPGRLEGWKGAPTLALTGSGTSPTSALRPEVSFGLYTTSVKFPISSLSRAGACRRFPGLGRLALWQVCGPLGGLVPLGETRLDLIWAISLGLVVVFFGFFFKKNSFFIPFPFPFPVSL